MPSSWEAALELDDSPLSPASLIAGEAVPQRQEGNLTNRRDASVSLQSLTISAKQLITDSLRYPKSTCLSLSFKGPSSFVRLYGWKNCKAARRLLGHILLLALRLCPRGGKAFLGCHADRSSSSAYAACRIPASLQRLMPLNARHCPTLVFFEEGGRESQSETLTMSARDLSRLHRRLS